MCKMWSNRFGKVSLVFFNLTPALFQFSHCSHIFLAIAHRPVLHLYGRIWQMRWQKWTEAADVASTYTYIYCNQCPTHHESQSAPLDLQKYVLINHKTHKPSTFWIILAQLSIPRTETRSSTVALTKVLILLIFLFSFFLLHPHPQ